MDKISRLKSLFEMGRFEEAMLGSDEFFLRNHTWGTHDTLVIFYHLFSWLKPNSEISIIRKIEEVFDEISESSEVSEIDNGLLSLGLIRSYCIKGDGQEFWPISKEFLLGVIEKIKNNFSADEYESLNIRRDINLLKEYLPDLKIISSKK